MTSPFDLVLLGWEEAIGPIHNDMYLYFSSSMYLNITTCFEEIKYTCEVQCLRTPENLYPLLPKGCTRGAWSRTEHDYNSMEEI